jgi:UDP-N-acetylmuramoyl-tripeptide--D-alanyl-D-alanine ligase
MLELGNSSIQEHSDMISFVKKLNFDLTVFVGKEFMKARDNNFGMYLSTVKTARKWFYKQKFKNTHILLKASRGIAIERIINH